MCVWGVTKILLIPGYTVHGVTAFSEIFLTNLTEYFFCRKTKVSILQPNNRFSSLKFELNPVVPFRVKLKKKMY